MEGALHILITGAAGMVGRKLALRLVADGAPNGQPIDKLSLHDVVRFPGETLKPGPKPSRLSTFSSAISPIRARPGSSWRRART